MFSVIIPLYNKEKHIQQCIESVLDQTFDEYEIIVIDDGSTDDGPDIARSFKSEKINVYHQPNRGVSVARNSGLSKAKYDFLIFLDADDGLMPTFMDEISVMIEKYSEADIFATNFYNYKMAFGVLEERQVSFLPEHGIVTNYFELILSNNPILASVFVIKKHVFKESGGYIEGMYNGEDTYLFSKLLLSHDLCFLNKPLYYRTYDSENKASDIYRPADVNTSLLDYLNSGVRKADEYIINYSLYQVKELIKSGYKDEAMAHLKKINSVVPKEHAPIVESEKNEIYSLLNRPEWYFKNRDALMKKMVYMKNFLKYKLNLHV